jgi:hypothetical protein
MFSLAGKALQLDYHKSKQYSVQHKLSPSKQKLNISFDIIIALPKGCPIFSNKILEK